MRIINIIVLTATLAYLPTGCLFMGGTGKIMGRVRDSNGNVIAMATVTTSPVTETVITNNVGIYYIENVPSGDYVISALSYSESGSTIATVPRLGIISCDAGFTNSDIELSEVAEETEEEEAQEGTGEIEWYNTYAEGLAAAIAASKPMMIDFYADWCGWCDVLDENTYTDSQVISKANGFICVKVDADVETTIISNYSITGLPTIVFTEADGTELHRIVGYVEPAPFIIGMDFALEQL